MSISSASSASSASPAAKTGVRHATAILAVILVSYFMILLDDSIIFTALPKIHAAMQFSPGGLDWVFRQRAGWPRAMSAITLARELFTSGGDQ